MNIISVIMPIYNTDEFLEQSIYSVLNQTYQDFELILINDGSDDDCKKIIDHFKTVDQRIKAYHFKKRVGVGSARNFGIDKSSGAFVYFLDSDDFLKNNTLELLLENINDHKFITGCHKGAHLSDAADNDVEENKSQPEIEIYKKEKFNLFRNNSALNCLFNLDFIRDNNIRFSEKVEIYSDLLLIISALANVTEVPYVEEAIYYKRERNDPITNPSLMQTSMESRIINFTSIYNDIKERYTNKEISSFIDYQFLNFYRQSIVQYFNINKNVDSVFSALVKVTKRVDSKILRKHPFITRKEINTIKQNNIELFKRVNLRHHRIRKLKTALKGRTKLYIQLYRALFLRMPIKKDTIVFESFLGKSYSDSPKYIYEYMIEKNMNYNYIWIFNKKKKIPGNAIQVKRFSLKYYYYLARAKYWVTNSRMPKSLNKRKDNIYLQTWHGTPLKTLVFDMKDVYSADPAYKKNFYQQSRRWDYLSSTNEYSSNIFRRAFKYEKEMLEFGYPRNDILYNSNTKHDILKLKNKMNLPTNKKVVLYAPTWRDDEFYSRGKYKFTLKLDLERLKNKLGNEYIVLLRMHYFIASQLDITGFEGFVYNFSHYDDIAELYLVSDILITDYSSVFFDYANLKRPILFYTYDLEKYRDKLRGFYIDMEKEVPGPLLMNTNEVIDAILNIDEVSNHYQDRYNSFYDKFCQWDDGNATERTVKVVFNQ